jgi:phosphoglucosamine mutase
MERLFGTDGIRGRANQHPITPELTLRLGKAIAHVVQMSGAQSRRCVIGKDTRLSGYMIESSLTSGLVSMGMDVYLVGPMPTPALARLTKSMAASAGIMITASHNPASDNGIKIFNGDGFKLSDELEVAIEKFIIGDQTTSHHVDYARMGKAYRIEDARGRYIEFAKHTIGDRSLAGLKVVLDCANGAAYYLGPLIFRELGAEVVVIGTEPDGFNINRGCGALAVERCQERVVTEDADLGIALDGDADRAIFVDRSGTIIDGDKILGLLAVSLKERGQLKGDTLVATVMSNVGLHRAMEANGIEVVTTPVGDRNVIEHMRSHDHNLGGENSGHIIMMEHATTGDGIVSALAILRIMLEKENRDLGELTDFVEIFPYKLLNLDVREKRDLSSVPEVNAVLRECDMALGDNGRHLLRYSGTENKIRILVEAKTKREVSKWTTRIANVVKATLT